MRLRRGTWVPLLPLTARIAVVTLVTIEPVLRGVDYILPDAEPPATQLTVIESAMPLWCWGILCLLAGVIAFAGFVGRWRRVAVLGLWVGASTYAVLAIGQWVAVAGQPWLDGMRGPAIVTLLALAQGGMALGYAAQPDDGDVAREVGHG